MKASPVWTEDELKILRDLYPKQGPKRCLKHLPGRTLESVKTKATRIGLLRFHEKKKPQRNQHKAWTQEQMNILRKHYPETEPLQLVKLLPGRSISAIYRQANKMGLVRMKQFRGGWQEVQILDDVDEHPFKQRVVPAGEWKAEVPRVRSVFDLGVAA